MCLCGVLSTSVLLAAHAMAGRLLGILIMQCCTVTVVHGNGPMLVRPQAFQQSSCCGCSDS